MREKSAWSAYRCSCGRSRRHSLSLFSPSWSCDFTRASTSAGVGEMLGSRLTKQLIAQPFSALKLARSRRPFQFTVAATDIPLAEKRRFYARAGAHDRARHEAG